MRVFYQSHIAQSGTPHLVPVAVSCHTVIVCGDQQKGIPQSQMLDFFFCRKNTDGPKLWKREATPVSLFRVILF